MPCQIRKYRTSDLSDLRKIYASSIRHIGKTAYSNAQVEAWSSFPNDVAAFAAWIGNAQTYVAFEGDGACIGFGGLEEDGRVSAIFVSPHHMRKGVASQLLSQLVADAKAKGLNRMRAEASEFSKPLFEKFGFSVVEVERTDFNGIKFNRYVMRASI